MLFLGAVFAGCAGGDDESVGSGFLNDFAAIFHVEPAPTYILG